MASEQLTLMANADTNAQPTDKFMKRKSYGLYMQNVLTRKVELEFTTVGKNIKELLQKKLAQNMEGRCVVEGYIKPDSVRVVNYSAGELVSSNVQFVVVFECLVCNPVENQLVKARALSITKAGIKAEAVTKGESPLVIYIVRDHNYKNKQFSTIKEDDEFSVRIIGQRYEINDTVITVIGELTRDKSKKTMTKPKLVINKD